MNKIKILWVDDEIDLLKPHILFLEKLRGNVDLMPSQYLKKIIFVFFDENMPGMSGLETLSDMKKKKSTVPMIMITGRIYYGGSHRF
jgi:DNA-binding response OmpR family regulator